MSMCQCPDSVSVHAWFEGRSEVRRGGGGGEEAEKGRAKSGVNREGLRLKGGGGRCNGGG